MTEKLFPRQRSLGGCVCNMCASVECRGNHAFLVALYAALIKCPETKQCKGGRVHFNCGTGDPVHCGWGRMSNRNIRPLVTLQPQSGSQE